MFAISIAFGTGAQMWCYLFKTEEKAREAYAAMLSFEPIVNIADDFGQQATFKRESLVALQIENLEESANAAIERHLHTLRMQVRGQTAVDGDPKLRAAAMLRGQGFPAHPGPMPRA